MNNFSDREHRLVVGEENEATTFNPQRAKPYRVAEKIKIEIMLLARRGRCISCNKNTHLIREIEGRGNLLGWVSGGSNFFREAIKANIFGKGGAGNNDGSLPRKHKFPELGGNIDGGVPQLYDILCLSRFLQPIDVIVLRELNAFSYRIAIAC